MLTEIIMEGRIVNDFLKASLFAKYKFWLYFFLTLHRYFMTENKYTKRKAIGQVKKAEYMIWSYI